MNETRTAAEVSGRYAHLLVLANAGALQPIPRPGSGARAIASARRKPWEPVPDHHSGDWGIPAGGKRIINPGLSVVESMARLEYAAMLETHKQPKMAAETINEAERNLAAIDHWVSEQGITLERAA